MTDLRHFRKGKRPFRQWTQLLRRSQAVRKIANSINLSGDRPSHCAPQTVSISPAVTGMFRTADGIVRGSGALKPK
jgi:hypothetical protein